MSDGKEKIFITVCTKEESESAVRDEIPQVKLFKKYGHFFENGGPADNLFLRQCRYTDEEAEVILREAEEWEIEVKYVEGYDMGYGTEGEDTTYRTMPVPESIILAADGHFAGVVETSSSGTYTHPQKFGSSVHAALIKNWEGDPMFYAGNSSSFSSDDHESWSSTSYYLRKKG